ncbi:MAG: beta-phosphoglucomutase [Eubacteriales bacterium]
MKNTNEAATEYRGVIFDLDGVICSTDEYHFEAWSALAEKLGITNFTREDNNRQRGVSRMESLEILLEKSSRTFTEEEKIKLAEEKNNIYVGFLQNMGVFDLDDEVKITLNTLRKAGLKLAIGSSSKNTKLILERIGLGDFFDAVSDGNGISKSKPEPEVFLRAAKMLDLEPSSCLVVEDASAGILAAHRGGFDSAGIGEASMDKLTTYPLQHFSQLSDILLKH